MKNIINGVNCKNYKKKTKREEKAIQVPQKSFVSMDETAHVTELKSLSMRYLRAFS